MSEVNDKVESKRMVAALLAIFFGWTGAHKFYLGYTKAGIIEFVSNIACCAGSFIGLIEGIMYLTKSDAEFIQTYQVGKKEWF
jgi:TM2 domain-containing membrane protein YozV